MEEKKPITKLVVKVFEVKVERIVIFKPGYKYTYLFDPETGIYYDPKPTFQVTGEHLEDLFEEFKEEEL